MHTHLQENFARIFATNPGTPPPVTSEELEALRVRADIECSFDFFAREEAKRETARERRMREHPDPRDPDHPEEEE